MDSLYAVNTIEIVDQPIGIVFLEEREILFFLDKRLVSVYVIFRRWPCSQTRTSWLRNTAFILYTTNQIHHLKLSGDISIGRCAPV